ncbi:unnamed protein product [Owenia fusiformis]|uniref:Uncharacterized protein n=1 Tax=Owenia fusiformis TaxID=6347 RepID=A0A8J1Y1Z7_OWEFU|nr:unnamed protein product [Owenia fusiformis]
MRVIKFEQIDVFIVSQRSGPVSIYFLQGAPSDPIAALYEPVPSIVNGDRCEQHEFPYQLSLQVDDFFDGWRHTCGAVLINPSIILTAAHCVNGAATDYRIVAGAHIRNRVDVTGVEEVIPVSSIIQHEDFIQDGSVGFPNDIALLNLSSPITIDAATKAVVPLPPNNQTTFAGQRCIITGWGDTSAGDGTAADILKKATLPILSPEECTSFWAQANADLHICIYDETGRQGSCQGDSGGPMSCDLNGQNVVAGITSWGVVGCIGMPSVYVRTATYLQWICTNSNNAVAGCSA